MTLISTMVSGHLEVKKGYYYAVLSYIDKQGKRQRPWVSTGLPEKGNKRKAEAKLAEIRATYSPPVQVEDLSSDMPFSDYLERWLEIAKVRIKLPTESQILRSWRASKKASSLSTTILPVNATPSLPDCLKTAILMR